MRRSSGMPAKVRPPNLPARHHKPQELALASFGCSCQEHTLFLNTGFRGYPFLFGWNSFCTRKPALAPSETAPPGPRAQDKCGYKETEAGRRAGLGETQPLGRVTPAPAPSVCPCQRGAPANHHAPQTPYLLALDNSHCSFIAFNSKAFFLISILDRFP